LNGHKTVTHSKPHVQSPKAVPISSEVFIHHHHEEWIHHHMIHGRHPVNLRLDEPLHQTTIPKINSTQFAKQHDSTVNGIDLRSKMPPIYNQGQIGSCTANALLCAAFHVDDVTMNGSRLFLYYNERKIEGKINVDGGASLADGVNAMHTYGLCHEDLWTYSCDEKFRLTPTQECYNGAYV